MVEAARGFFVHGRSQKEVAEDLGVSQATISRLLTRAREDRVIQFHIEPRPEQTLSHELADKLKNTCVQSVIVVPGGTGKNEGNLAVPAASLILGELARMGNVPIRLTASAGQTMLSVFEALIRGMSGFANSPVRAKSLVFYPSTLMPDHSVDLSYPATLATTLALHVNRAYGGDFRREPGGDSTADSSRKASPKNDSPTDERLHIQAFAPSLPKNFYDLDPEERADYLERFKVNEAMGEALSAQMFVIGIGDAKGQRYQNILGQMNRSFLEHLTDAVAEICWVPIDSKGRVIEEVAQQLVSVKPSELRDRARDGSRRVIAVAGGESKLAAIEAAMIDPCFSTLVTDVVNARRLLKSDEVGGGR